MLDMELQDLMFSMLGLGFALVQLLIDYGPGLCSWDKNVCSLALYVASS